MKKNKWLLVLVTVAFAISLVLAGCGGGDKQEAAKEPEKKDPVAEAAEFYNGKTINMIIPYTVGGGFDFYARMAGKYMEKYIPGSTVVPVNVPGAGGLKGTNQLYATKPDGLTIGVLNVGGNAFNEILGGEGVMFEQAKFGWIGRVTAEPHAFYVGKNFKYASLKDAKADGAKLKLGFNGVGSDDYFAVSLLLDAMGIPYEMITGYDGTPEVIMGVLRGEIDGSMNTISGVLPQVKEGNFKVIAKLGVESELMPAGVEDAIDLVSGDNQAVVKGVAAMFKLDRSVAAPPGLDEGKLEYLRQVFDKAVADPEFKAECNAAKRPLNVMPGKELPPMLDDVMAAAAKIKPVLERVMKAGQK